ECDSCRAIAAGSSLDVIEMDAASNRSIEDVRDLRERVGYAPAVGRFKVYILDEAHMLTKEAWNAFLKTLEEPPPNTVFVLATTEAHKVMATIADRCQRFDFQRPSLEQISEVLRRVAVAEGIEVEDAAVATIARSASGSFRDALGTLDQLVAFGGSRVELGDVLELLGAADAELLFEAVDAVVAEDPRGALLGVERMARSGRDPVQFARDLLAHLRHLLVTQTVGEVPDTFVVTATDPERLIAQATAIGSATLVRTIDELAAALTAVREGDDARMAVEIALLKAARPDLDPTTEGLLRRIERLEQGTEALRAAGPGAVAGGSTPSLGFSPAEELGLAESRGRKTGRRSSADPPTPAPPAADTVSVDDPGSGASTPDDSAAGGAAGGTAPEEASATAGGGGSPAATGPAAQHRSTLSLDEIARIWPAVLQKLAETAPALAATFEGARPVALEDDELRIGFPADKTFNKRKAEAPERREAVAEAFEAVLGERVRATYVLLDVENAGSGDGEAEPELDEAAFLERIKSEFDAKEVG
ncbi:MAG TPA: DNA polymerase III subunit gamma/tau, partial [Solirubrobacterales bacterium]|nr:DNA polymerase III subunit gamma/tau [Solirubrobacterales bacterium]